MNDTSTPRNVARLLTRRVHANQWQPVDQYLAQSEWARFDDLGGWAIRSLLIASHEPGCHSVTQTQPIGERATHVDITAHLQDAMPWHLLNQHEQNILARWLANPDAALRAMAASLADDETVLLTTDEAAALAKVSAATIRKWRERGHLYPSAVDHRNDPLYVPRLVLDAARRPQRLPVRKVQLDHPDALMTAAAAAVWLGVGASTIRTWAHRGKVEQHAVDGQGRPLYRAGDLYDIHQGKRLTASSEGASPPKPAPMNRDADTRASA